MAQIVQRPNTKLKSLILALNCGLGAQTVILIFSHFKNLKRVDLGGCELSGPAFEALLQFNY